MILGLLFGLLFLYVVYRVLRRRHRAKANAAAAGTPLAGYDTGVRSVFRTPGSKFLGPRKGF